MIPGDEVKLTNKQGLPVPGIYLGRRKGRELFRNLLDKRIVWRVPEIRECVDAKAGYKILAADYSQIEIKLMAFLSNDPDMIRALNTLDARGNPTDIHCYISTMVYGERLKFDYEEMISVILEKAPGGKKHPRYKEFKRMRSNIKTTTFGVPYGSGAKGVAARCGISEEEAQQVIDDFFKQFPVLKKWLDEQGARAILLGNTETPAGRKRYYEVLPVAEIGQDAYDIQVRQINRWAGNHPIQAASADMLKLALSLIYARMRNDDLSAKSVYDARIIMVVHDEIVLVCKETDVPAVSAIMKACMEEAYAQIIGKTIPNEVLVVPENSWEKV